MIIIFSEYKQFYIVDAYQLYNLFKSFWINSAFDHDEVFFQVLV